MRRQRWAPALLLALVGGTAHAALSVTVTPSIPSPALVGTVVTFNARVTDSSSHVGFRFRIRPQDGDFHMVRDFQPVSSLTWTASDHEGVFDVEVSVRDLDSGESAQDVAVFAFSPRGGYEATIAPTQHPLVFLYSAPPCASLQTMSVEFSAADGSSQHTPPQRCGRGLSMNFYLAGLRAETTYSARHVIRSADGELAEESPESLTFTTGRLPNGLYNDTVEVPSGSGAVEPILLGSPLASTAVAHDLQGNVVWFGPPEISYITRVEEGGIFWGLVGSTTNDPAQQLIRKFDLTGMTLLETNAARVNEQLVAMGMNTISAFHHEASPLPDGRIAVLGGVERILSDVQGPGPIDIAGDMIIVLDKEMNVVWAWDTFDHLDVRRAAVLGETCAIACPPLLLAKTANDWTHANSIQPTADGNLLLSVRHQDWLIKIDYASSSGSGRILWRLGPDGDFRFDSRDPFPWFSHQHDANFEDSFPVLDMASGYNYARTPLPRLMVFDNGNTRVAAYGGNSRGQVLEIDEAARRVTAVLNVDLGVYSMAVGSAEKLSNGNYHFDAGYVQGTSGVSSRGIEVAPDGEVVYDASANTPLYRSFRMADMYTPK